MSNPSLGPVDETPAVRSPVTDDVLRAVRVMIDAYRLSAASRDVDVILNGILDGVADLVAYDAAGIYVLGRSNRRVRHWRWRGAAGGPPAGGGVVGASAPAGPPQLVTAARSVSRAPEAQSLKPKSLPQLEPDAEQRVCVGNGVSDGD